MEKEINFYAGPSKIEKSVIDKALNYIGNENKLSILEISHRSKEITNLFDETRVLLKEIMGIGDDKEILFLHGGASMQFLMIPINIKTDGCVGFIDTGIWSKKAIVECKKIRKTKIIASGKRDCYNSIPMNYNIDSDIAYLHFTTNNTIYGTQFHDFPDTEIPLVADMSSDILSRRLDFDKFDLIFAGFQKNLGTAGGCLVIVDKKIIDTKSNTPSMLDYNVHIKNSSMFNTPPVFAILMCNLTLKWIKDKGGLDIIEKNNIRKAKLLYGEIDRNSLFTSFVAVKDRSLMNICFDAIDDKVGELFYLECKKNGIIGIKGHRVKGGFRASLYNAMPYEDVVFLVEVMKNFELENI